MNNNTNNRNSQRMGACRNGGCLNNGGCANNGSHANNGGCSRRGGCPGRVGCGNCRVLMDRLRAVDFALNETVLYLDAYPTCDEAMSFYKQLVTERKQLVEAYETEYGPLTMYGNVANTWDWAEGPWPWEAEANG